MPRMALLSNVTYPSVSGTGVSRDFVELPSQLYEHWLTVPEILKTYAVHYQTGEPMPQALLDKVLAARTFNAGFNTVEFTSSALVDMAFHTRGAVEDPMAVQADVLEKIGMPASIVMRHATPHFQHVFSGDGYSAGYYSYMWSEVLDADAFAAFEETGNPFDPEMATKLKTYLCVRRIGRSGGCLQGLPGQDAEPGGDAEEERPCGLSVATPLKRAAGGNHRRRFGRFPLSQMQKTGMSAPK